MGNWLKKQEKAKGGRPLKDKNLSEATIGFNDEKETLADMGITQDQSSNWQRIASIPEGELENYEEK